MKAFWVTTYFSTSVLCFLVAFEFWKTKDGILRKIMVFKDLSIGMALFLISFRGVLDLLDMQPVSENLIRALTIIPIFFSMSLMYRYMKKPQS